VLYELVRYKRSLLLGAENDPVSVSLPPFSSDKRKTCRRQGEINVNNDQTATTSADKLKPLTITINNDPADSMSTDELKLLTITMNNNPS